MTAVRGKPPSLADIEATVRRALNTIPEPFRRHLEDEVWATLFARQRPRLAGAMCHAFVEGLERAGLDPRRMPRHRELSRRMERIAGWRVETVPGLIPVADFFALGFSYLQVELLTRQMRYSSRLDEDRFRTDLIEAALQLRYQNHDGLRFVRLGKPHAAIFEQAFKNSGTRDMIMIGDQLETDIRGAKAFGIDCALIDTGVTQIGAAGLPGYLRPSYRLTTL